MLEQLSFLYFSVVNVQCSMPWVTDQKVQNCQADTAEPFSKTLKHLCSRGTASCLILPYQQAKIR